jgi:ribosome-associated translation inhibitor RaiA
MDIQITAKDVMLTPADETYICNRLYFALAANHQDLANVEVSLCAIPGFESEGIQHCRVQIQLANGCAVIGDSSESNIYVAIDRAVERSCSKVTCSDEPQWPAFSHSGSIPFATKDLSSAAYGHHSA